MHIRRISQGEPRKHCLKSFSLNYPGLKDQLCSHVKHRCIFKLYNLQKGAYLDSAEELVVFGLLQIQALSHLQNIMEANTKSLRKIRVLKKINGSCLLQGFMYHLSEFLLLSSVSSKQLKQTGQWSGPLC